MNTESLQPANRDLFKVEGKNLTGTVKAKRDPQEGFARYIPFIPKPYTVYAQGMLGGKQVDYELLSGLFKTSGQAEEAGKKALHNATDAAVGKVLGGHAKHVTR